MGMYTEFIFGCQLSKDTPKECVDALDYTINGERKNKTKFDEFKRKVNIAYNKFIKHKHISYYWEDKTYFDITTSKEDIDKFIDEYDFNRLFHSSSYYFGAANPCSKFYYDNISDSYHIATRADLKNGGAIEKFLEYIEPYIVYGSGTSNVYAYVQYVEAEFPTLYTMKGKIDVIDPEITKKWDELNDKQWNVLGDAFEKLAPEYCITDDELKRHGKEPGKETYYDGWLWMLEYIVRKYEKYNDFNLINIENEDWIISDIKKQLKEAIKKYGKVK